MLLRVHQWQLDVLHVIPDPFPSTASGKGSTAPDYYYMYILEKWFPLQGELAQSFKKFYVRTLYKNKIERRKRRRQNKNRPTNLPQGNNIVHILRVHYLTLTLSYTISIYQLYIFTYIHTYIHTYYESL